MKQKKSGLSVAFLYDDTLDSNDGVAQYVKKLGVWLNSQGHSVTYLVGQSQTKNWAGGDVVSLSRNLKLRWGGNRLSIALIPKLSAISQTLNDRHFDVLHVQVPYSPFMSQLVINRATADTAVIGSFHVFPSNKLSIAGSKLLKVLYGKSLRRFDTMLSVSAAAQTYAQQSFGIDTIISPNVISIRDFNVRQPLAEKGKRIIFLGRLVERKGCLQLIKAFSLLHRSLPQARLIIAGDGPQRQKLEKYVNNQHLDNVVDFLGYVREEDKASLLASAEIACFPSLYGESFGIVLIEAMAAGAKVVLGGYNAGYSTVLGERPKLLINPTETQMFAERLTELLTDEKLIEKLHQWQRSAVRQYDLDVVGPEIVEIYNRAIASRLKSRHN